MAGELALFYQSDYSDACLPKTQRRYLVPSQNQTIRRLLLAATLSADAVAIYWLLNGDRAMTSITLYLALAFAQLSVLCVHVILFRSKVGARWLWPFAAGAVAAFISTFAGRSQLKLDILLAFTALMWLHVAGALSLLWLLKPTRLLANLSERPDKRSWQFGVVHLLVWMTCLPMLIVVMNGSQPFLREIGQSVSLTIANVFVLIATLSLMNKKWLWPFHLAASLGVAFVVATICEGLQTAFANGMNAYAYYLLQTIVIWVWAETTRPRFVANEGAGGAASPAEAAR